MRLTLWLVVLFGCHEPGEHGPIAEGISASLGDIRPSASEEQVATFFRGRDVAQRRFTRSTGLGPAFNVTFCGACHEKPVTGGSSGLYRNFFIAGTADTYGNFTPTVSAGNGSGVIRMYDHSGLMPARPVVMSDVNVATQRNGIPFFGVGLLAEIPEREILRREDPEDRDGDGISGRVNWDQGYVGRFGVKAQTVSIEKFLRGPLFNHAGVTSDPLSDEARARLPVDSSGGVASLWLPESWGFTVRHTAQAAAPDEPTYDDDGVADPELAPDDLFDLVSFAMLLAAPEFDPDTPDIVAGRVLFDVAGCDRCHTPRLSGPRGPIPAYSDLLLHDMGDDLADGVVMGDASGHEFRTQPLWGLAAVGPYLHDGRAHTVRDAIEWHGGEGEASRDAWRAMSAGEQDQVLAFLGSLGGRSQASTGLLPPDAPIPGVGEYGGPVRPLSEGERAMFHAGRERFDHDFGFVDGVGGPGFNGDSCRACHFDPVIGGSGPQDVNAMRHGRIVDDEFVAPAGGTMLHKETSVLDAAISAPTDANVYEMRQTPHLFGLGLIDGIPEAEIIANADPEDSDQDGISGRVSWVSGGRVGRFGWKAGVPSVSEFVRDAMAFELGVTLPPVDGLTFGFTADADEVPDPELTALDAEMIALYLNLLGPPPRGVITSDADAGSEVFREVGCDACHVPYLLGADTGPVPLYSDLLLHEVLAAPSWGIVDGDAGMWEFRTPPLWGLAKTAPYLHDGSAETFAQAIDAHHGEGQAAHDAWEGLTDLQRAQLDAFLGSL